MMKDRRHRSFLRLIISVTLVLPSIAFLSNCAASDEHSSNATPSSNRTPKPTRTAATIVIRSVSQAMLKNELQEAQSLLARAEGYAEVPAITDAADWYDEDQRFKDHIGLLSQQFALHPGNSDWDGVGADVANNLVQSESFLYAAVQDAVSMCNAHDAKANLRVARADINEAGRDLRKSARDPENWSPPEIEESGDDDCHS